MVSAGFQVVHHYTVHLEVVSQLEFNSNLKTLERGQSYTSYEDAYHLAVLNFMHIKITVDDTRNKLLSTCSLYFLHEAIMRMLNMGQECTKVRI